MISQIEVWWKLLWTEMVRDAAKNNLVTDKNWQSNLKSATKKWKTKQLFLLLSQSSYPA